MPPMKWPRTPPLSARIFPSLVVMLPRNSLCKFIFLWESFHYFSLSFFFWKCLLFWALLFFFFIEFIQVQFPRPSLWTRYTYNCLNWLFITNGFWTMVVYTLVFMNEYLLPFSVFIRCWTCYVFVYERIFSYVHHPCYFYGLSVIRPLVRLYLRL